MGTKYESPRQTEVFLKEEKVVYNIGTAPVS